MAYTIQKRRFNIIMDGLIFGMVDNGILLLSMYTGLGIERWFTKNNTSFIGGVIGAGVGNTFSDALGASLDPSLNHTVIGITIGCILPLFLIPVIQYIRRHINGIK